jgi:hypothetical protein
MLLVFVGLGEVPDRALRLIVTASAHNGCARVLVLILIGPLPYVAGHIHHAKWARSMGMSIHIARGGIVRSLSGVGASAVAGLLSEGQPG